MERRIGSSLFDAFCDWLREAEREPSTIEKYLRDIRTFAIWLDGQTVCKERVAQWKECLQREGHKSVTINGKLSAINKFFAFWGGQTAG